MTDRDDYGTCRDSMASHVKNTKFILNLNTQKLNLNLNQLSTSMTCAYHCVKLSYTEQNSSDNFPSHPPDNHHGSDDVCWRGGGITNQKGLLPAVSPYPTIRTPLIHHSTVSHAVHVTNRKGTEWWGHHSCCGVTPAAVCIRRRGQLSVVTMLEWNSPATPGSLLHTVPPARYFCDSWPQQQLID